MNAGTATPPEPWQAACAAFWAAVEAGPDHGADPAAALAWAKSQGAVAAWKAAAAAARQPQPAPGDASGLLEPLHALAAKWEASADRNQRNGQSLIDQGDEYGNEGLVAADALSACVVDLRAVLADAPEQPAPGLSALADELDRLADEHMTKAGEYDRDAAQENFHRGCSAALRNAAGRIRHLIASQEQPAPELAAAFPAAQAALARVLSWFAEEPEFGPSRRYARATRAQLAHAYKDGGLSVPEGLRRFL